MADGFLDLRVDAPEDQAQAELVGRLQEWTGREVRPVEWRATKPDWWATDVAPAGAPR